MKSSHTDPLPKGKLDAIKGTAIGLGLEGTIIDTYRSKIDNVRVYRAVFYESSNDSLRKELNITPENTVRVDGHPFHIVSTKFRENKMFPSLNFIRIDNYDSYSMYTFPNHKSYNVNQLVQETARKMSR